MQRKQNSTSSVSSTFLTFSKKVERRKKPPVSLHRSIILAAPEGERERERERERESGVALFVQDTMRAGML